MFGLRTALASAHSKIIQKEIAKNKDMYLIIDLSKKHLSASIEGKYEKDNKMHICIMNSSD